MKFLFLHHNFPGQFRWITKYLARLGHDVVFLCETNYVGSYPGISVIQVMYDGITSHASLEGQLACGDRFRRACEDLRNSGWYPDYIISHSGWGCGLDTAYVFPTARKLSYLEWWFADQCPDYDFEPNSPWWTYTEATRAKLRRRNLTMSLELAQSDGIISPTQWQASQLPSSLRQRCVVIHEGVDTNFFVMNPAWRPNDRVRITYATRGMEQMRGFPHFIDAVKEILPNFNVEVVIAGSDKIAYGSRLPPEGTFGLWARNKLAKYVEQGSVKFVGALPIIEYARLLKSSHIHCYFTRPFVLSWSLLDAMASGCDLVCSDVEPVREVAHPSATTWVDHRNINGIATAISNLVERSDEKRFAHGLLQRKLVETSYTRDSCLSQWLDLFEISDSP